MIRHRRALALAIFALTAAGAPGCSDKASASGKPTAEAAHDTLSLDPSSPQRKFIKVEDVVASEGGPAVVLTGHLTFDEDRTQRVSTPIDGRATAILVKLGDKVTPGQALITLSSPQVGQLQADAQKAQQDLQIAQKTVDRYHRMKVDGAVSDKDIAQAEADLQKAKSDVGRSASGLRAIGLGATDPTTAASIRAQIAGSVVERNVLVGQEVRADATMPLLTVSNLDQLWVIADVYEQDLGLVSMGANVTVRVPAYPNETFSGVVNHVAEVLDPVSRTVKLKAVLPNPSGRLKPEMFAKIELSEPAGHPVIMIPSKAVLNDGGKSRVIVAEGNAFRVRPVDVGSEAEGRVRVLTGLKAGEKIVTDGALFLKHDIDDR